MTNIPFRYIIFVDGAEPIFLDEDPRPNLLEILKREIHFEDPALEDYTALLEDEVVTIAQVTVVPHVFYC